MAKYYLQLHKSLQPASVAAKMALVTPETTAQYEERNQIWAGFFAEHDGYAAIKTAVL